MLVCLHIAATPTFGYAMDDFHARFLPILEQRSVPVTNYVVKSAEETQPSEEEKKEDLHPTPTLTIISALEAKPRTSPRFSPYVSANDSANRLGTDAFIRAMSSLQGSSRTDQDLYFYLLGLVQYAHGDISSARISFNNALMQSTQPGSESVRLKTLLSLYELEKQAESHLLALEYITEYQKTFKRINARDTLISANSAADSLSLPTTNQAENTPISQHWTFYSMLVLLMLLLFTTLLLLREKQIPLLWLKTKMETLGGLQVQFPYISLDKKGLTDSLEGSIDDTLRVDEIKIEKLIKLRSMRLLTEDEWDEFKIIFDSIYPDLFIRLLEGGKTLTVTDEKVVCLLRLHCNTQEIAIRLGISQNSANTARSRLRKRLGLAHHEYIEEFLLRHSTPNAFDERYKKRKN